MDAQPTYVTVFDRTRHLRLGGVRQGVESHSIVREPYRDKVFGRGDGHLYLCKPLMAPVSHHVDDQLFEHKVDSEDNLRGPTLPLCKFLDGACEPLQFRRIVSQLKR